MIVQGLNITRDLDPSNLTQEQLGDLREEIGLGSIYISDYKNNYKIPADRCYDFFEGYMEDLYYRMQEDIDESGENIDIDSYAESHGSEYDNIENLYNWYLMAEDPFGTDDKFIDGDTVTINDPEQVKGLIDNYVDVDATDAADINYSLQHPNVLAVYDDGMWSVSDAVIYFGEFTTDNLIDMQNIVSNSLGETLDESGTSDYVDGELDYQFSENDYVDDKFEVDDASDFWNNYLTDDDKTEIIDEITEYMDNNDHMGETVNDTFWDGVDDCDVLRDKMHDYKSNYQDAQLGEAMDNKIDESMEILWGTGNARDYLASLSAKDLIKELKDIGYTDADLEGKSDEELINMVSNDEYIDEIDEEDFYENIQPMIEKQTYKNIVLMAGTVGKWDGDIEGGKAVDVHELYDGDWDIEKIEIIENDEGHLVWRGYHHDGTHRMYLYAVPKEEEDLKKFVTELGLDEVETKWYGYDKDEAIAMAIEDLSATFLNDAIDDWSKVKDLCKPIINGLRTNAI